MLKQKNPPPIPEKLTKSEFIKLWNLPKDEFQIRIHSIKNLNNPEKFVTILNSNS